mgnify:CR=1 FL=1
MIIGKTTRARLARAAFALAVMSTAPAAAGELQVLLPHWPTPSLPVHLVSPSQRRQSAKVRAFADHLLAAG